VERNFRAPVTSFSRRLPDGAVLVTLYLLAVVSLGWAAERLGIAAGEAQRLGAAMDLSPFFTGGSGSLVQRAQAAGKAVTVLPTFLSGYLWLLLSRRPGGPHIDELLALRLGGVLVSALSTPLVYALARPRLGQPVALAAALFALLVPRGIEQGAVLGGDGVLVSLSLGALYAHLRAQPAGQAGVSWGWALGSALLFGLALAASWAALLLLPVVLAHHALVHAASARRLARAGQLTVSVTSVAWVLLAAPVLVLATPHLWTHPLSGLGDLAVQAASPLVGPGVWGGEPPAPGNIPRGNTATMLLLSLPSATSVLALVGLFAVLSRGSSRPREPLVALCAIALVALLGWPLVSPPALLAFPGHFALAVPFACVLAALGLAWVHRALCEASGSVPPGALASALGKALRKPEALLGLAVLVLLGPAQALVRTPATLSACFPLLAGGAQRAASGETVPLHDGTPALGLVAAIDGLSLGHARVYSPDVPAGSWELLWQLGRVKTRLEPVARPEAAKLLVLTGNPSPAVMAGARAVRVAVREGQPVLTLFERLLAGRGGVVRGGLRDSNPRLVVNGDNRLPPARIGQRLMDGFYALCR
jgi:hypothetical protein